MSLKEFKKKKPKEEKLWRYNTDHVDTMLWQYCLGLKNLVNRVPVGDNIRVTEIINKLSDEHFEHCSKMYNVSPSFTVIFVIEAGGRIEMKKSVL